MDSQRRRRVLTALKMMGGGKERIAPTCVISTTVLDPTPTAAIPITFTWSEDVTGFAVADITLGNCTIGDLTAVSASVYTATITATATGTVTVDIAAGVCVDLAGNANAAATQFSMVYIQSVVFLMSDRDLFQDAAKTTPATANDDLVGNWEDQSGNGNDFTAATTARPTLKTNIIGDLPGILFDGGTDVLKSASFASGIQAYNGVGYTLYILANGSTNYLRGMFARGTYDPVFYTRGDGSHAVKMYRGASYLYNTVVDTAPHVFTFRRPDATANGYVRLWVDNVLDADADNPDVVDWGTAVLSIGSDGASTFHDGYIYAVILCAGGHSDAQVAAINAKLIEKKNSMIAASFTVNSSAVLVNDDENWFGNPTLTVM